MSDELNAIHVVPINDLRDHDESNSCWCRPVEIFDVTTDVGIWVHNSMDRREHTIEKGLTQ